MTITEVKVGQKWVYADEHDFNHVKERECTIVSIDYSQKDVPPLKIESEVGAQSIWHDQLLTQII